MAKSDIALGAFILIPILCLIIPVPLFLLDILFGLNIALSMIILFNALFSKGASGYVDVSDDCFCCYDIVSTVIECQFYQKYLAVWMKRVMLLDTFGNFVGGGNLVVVGIVIFFVLIIMQFTCYQQRF